MATITQSTIDSATSANAEILVNGIPAQDGTTLNVGDIVELNATGGYVFGNASVGFQDEYGGMEDIPFAINSPTSASVTWGASWAPFGFWFTINTEAPQPILTFTQSIIDALAADNVEIAVNDVAAVDGTNVYSGDILTASTIGNFVFGSIALNLQYMLGDFEQKFFAVNDPPATATLDIGDWGDDLFSWYFSVVTVPYTPEVAGVNRVYKVSNQIITDINDVRFQQSGDTVIDYGDYILGLIQLPFAIDPEKLDEVGNIQLGNFDTQVEAESIKVDRLSVDLGTIEVPETEFNLLDFANVVCNLHLPLTQSVVVDSNYVIGETLGIEYLIDLYSGEATINLTSTKVNGDVFFSKQTTLGVNIPYIRTGRTANLDNANISVGGENHIKTPFIEVVKNDAVLPYGFFTIPIVDEGELFGEAGLVRVEQIDLEVATTTGEKNSIEQLLASGVIIK